MTATSSQTPKRECSKSAQAYEPARRSSASGSQKTGSLSGGSTSSLAPTPTKRGSNFVTKLVKTDDADLIKIAHEARAEIDWDTVMRSPRDGPDRWKRVGHVMGDFTVCTRQQAERFGVLAVGVVPGCVAEILNVLQSPNSVQYQQQMEAIYEDQYKEGMLVHRVDPTTSQSTTGSVSMPGSSQLRELTVKTVTFAKAKWFSDHEEWCYVDAVYRDSATGVVEKFMKTIPPSEMLTGLSKRKSKFFHDVTCAYLLRPGASDWMRSEDEVENAKRNAVTRVTIYAEFNGSNRVGIPRISKPSSLHASEKTMKNRILRLAEGGSRIRELVRRQRLGVQALIDTNKFHPPTRSACATCLRVVGITKVCRICGYGNCRTCCAKYEHAVQSKRTGRLEVSRIRVCTACIHRVDQAEYANLSSSSLTGPQIRPDPAEAPPSSSVLQELLIDALTTAPSPSRKACVMSVIQSLQDLESPTHSGNGSAVQLVEQEEDVIAAVEGIQVDLHLAMENDVRKLDERCYRVNTLGDPTVNSIPHPVPANEAQRLEAVERVGIEELRNMVELSIICDVAAQQMGCSMSTISIINQDILQVVASNLEELRNISVPRNESICSHTIMDKSANIVLHPEADIRFNKFASVDQFNVRYYCGFPIVDSHDQIVGAMCCVNNESVEITETQFAVFKKLARTASRFVSAQTSKVHQRSKSHGDC